jgi:hypothetical protein
MSLLTRHTASIADVGFLKYPEAEFQFNVLVRKTIQVLKSFSADPLLEVVD